MEAPQQLSGLEINCQKMINAPPDYQNSFNRRIINRCIQQNYAFDWKHLLNMKNNGYVKSLTLNKNTEEPKTNENDSYVMKIEFSEKYIDHIYPTLNNDIEEFKLKEGCEEKSNDLSSDNNTSVELKEITNNNDTKESSLGFNSDTIEDKFNGGELNKDHVNEEGCSAVDTNQDESLTHENGETDDSSEGEFEEMDFGSELSEEEIEEEVEEEIMDKRRKRTLKLIREKKLRGINYVRIEKLFDNVFDPMHHIDPVYEYTIYSAQFGQWETPCIFRSFHSYNTEKLTQEFGQFKPFGHLVIKVDKQKEIAIYVVDKIFPHMFNISSHNCKGINICLHDKYYEIFFTFSGFIPYSKKVAPLHQFYNPMRVQNFFNDTVAPVWEDFDKYCQVLAITIYPGDFNILISSLKECNFDSKIITIRPDNSVLSSYLFENYTFDPLMKVSKIMIEVMKNPQELYVFEELDTLKDLHFGWQWMTEKMVCDNVVVPNQITINFLEQLKKLRFEDYYISFQNRYERLINESNYNRIFNISLLLDLNPNSNYDLSKLLFSVCIDCYRTILQYPKIRSYSGIAYNKNNIFTSLTNQTEDVVLVEWSSKGTIVEDFVVYAMNPSVIQPILLPLSNKQYQLFTFILGTDYALYTNNFTSTYSLSDYSFSFLSDMNTMWKFKEFTQFIKVNKKFPSYTDASLYFNEFWKNSKPLFDLYGSGNWDYTTLNEKRYNRFIYIYEKYYDRLCTRSKKDNCLVKIKYDFFYDYTKWRDHVKNLRGSYHIARTKSELLRNFGINEHLDLFAYIPRVDLLGMDTYDLYNVIQYLKMKQEDVYPFLVIESHY
ncbi:Uncharacterized protein QTN25_003900 [Entamoeba marina]